MLLLLVATACTKEEISVEDTQLPYGAYPMVFSITDDHFEATASQMVSNVGDTRATADGDWADEPTIIVKVNNELKKYQIKVSADDITRATLSVSPEEKSPFYWQSRKNITVSA